MIIIVLFFYLLTAIQANEFYHERKGEMAVNVAYFDSATTHDLEPEKQALLKTQELTEQLINSPEVKDFKYTCESSPTVKKWKKYEKQLIKKNEELATEFKTIFHLGDTGTMGDEHNIVKRDFGISAAVFVFTLVVAAVATTYGITTVVKDNEVEGMKSAIIQGDVRADQMIAHGNAQDDKINELRDSLKVRYIDFIFLYYSTCLIFETRSIGY